MRFRFCWDCDCPDWVLAEIVTASKMPVNGFKDLCGIAIESICCEQLPAKQIEEVHSKQGEDGAAILAAITWIIKSAASSSTEAQVLKSELEQLGLPQQHCEIIVGLYGEHKAQIQGVLKEKSLKVSWPVTWDCSIKAIQIEDKKEAVVEVSVSGPVRELHKPFCQTATNSQSFYATPPQLTTLLYELDQMEKHMKQLVR